MCVTSTLGFNLNVEGNVTGSTRKYSQIKRHRTSILSHVRKYYKTPYISLKHDISIFSHLKANSFPGSDNFIVRLSFLLYYLTQKEKSRYSKVTLRNYNMYIQFSL